MDKLKKDDRVRVTFEGVIVYASGGQYDVIPIGDGPETLKCFLEPVISSSTFQIERIEPPLKVGDRVQRNDLLPGHSSEMDHLRIIDIDKGYAAVQTWNRTRDMRTGHSYGIVSLSDLERIA